ncbi:MAG: EF-hand domain-containing protein [Candidatus Hydrogenedentes bacterium]|nr:EF-hand domain-containing protein [Candidatus Hydrogenedentota bacterium]
MRYLRIICCASVVALCSFGATADSSADIKKPKASKSDASRKIDKDGDGRVSYEEMKAAFPGVTEEKFKARDKNGDGFLTDDERTITAPKPKSSETQGPKTNAPEPGQLFKKADKDGNGQVTWEEVHTIAPRLPQARFTAWDKNGDGAITKDELPARKPGAETAKTAANTNQPSMEQMARKADRDKSGSVTLEELHAVYPKFPQVRFEEMDKNKDGVLSPADRVQLARDMKEGADEAVTKLLESDANSDGKLTFDELTTAKPGFPREAFDQADRNKDGTISVTDSKRK